MKNGLSEIKRIEDQLRRTLEGEAWHGPALKELLLDISAGRAAMKPLSGAHSIWELVHHIIAWQDTVRQRLEGADVDSPLDGDFPDGQGLDEAAWRNILSKLEKSHQSLLDRVALLDESNLNDPVPGRPHHTVYFMLHGIIQHNLYHAGQIALLKRA